MDAGYTLLEHTADAGVIAWGPTPSEAFAQAARGMCAIMLGADPSAWRGAERRMALQLAVEGQDWDELLVNWLAQLLFHVEVDHCIPQRISFAQCAPPRCIAWVEGFIVEHSEALAGVGIKAVTYHLLDVQITPDRTDVRVIFDI